MDVSADIAREPPENRPAPRRSPAAGGYARGEEARRRIVEAALTRFAEDGYEGASTRRIAQEAGVNPPALQYYFNGKDGLHMACAQLLADRFSIALRPAYLAADAVAADAPEAAADALILMIEMLLAYLFERPSSEAGMRFMARGQGEEGTRPAYQWLRDVVGREFHRRAVRLVAWATDEAEDDPLVGVRTLAILAPVKAFHVGRTDTAARLCWPDIRGERLAMVRQVITEQARAALQAARRRTAAT